MRRSRSFSEMSMRRRIVAAVLLAVSLGIIGFAEKDLQGRSAAEVRGSKLVWRVVSLNALGALAYLRWGRTPA
ncbi:MAG: hypothetical protein JST31_04035 [Actinobacteria bacterium]|nr:hypothetical protein [Actinomycetota bacterium]